MAVAAATLALGSYAARHYAREQLTLSHYDARGHLVVARRIADSLTPGWQQIGAVWLPLPHLLNALPVRVDAWYRTGASGVVFSIVAQAVAVTALTWIVIALTGSPWAAGAAAAVMALNPNLLYLQSTPMTEPLLLGLMLSAVAALLTWCQRSDLAAWRVGILFACACLTRFEAWPVTAAALVLAGWVRLRRGATMSSAVAAVARVALVPGAAVAAFLVLSHVVVGRWFVADGFFVPDHTFASPIGAAGAVWQGTRSLSVGWLVGLASVGLVATMARALTMPARAHELVVVALGATASLPWAAFLRGHPFRVRYLVSTIALEALGVGLAVAFLRRWAPIGALAVVVTAAAVPGPFAPNAPMVVEAQLDVPQSQQRRTVTACLSKGYRGESIMASMGSLGHYMQQLASIGLTLRDFLHEGNGDIWLTALETPRPFVGWILIDEVSEGGDMLAQIARERPAFLDGFARRCEGGSVALYQRALGPSPELGSNGGPARRPGSAALSESHVEREEIRESTEVDRRPRETLVCREIANGSLVTDLATDIHRPYRESGPTENHRTGGRTRADERASKDRPVIKVDEFSGLCVSPPHDADASADVRHERVTMPEWEPTERGREWDDPQAEVLFDQTAVRVPKVGVRARHRSRGNTDTEAGVNLVAQGHQPLRAGGRPVEVAKVEIEKFEVVEENIVEVPCLLGFGHEATEIEIHRLLGGGGRGDQEDRRQCQRRRSP